MSRRIEVAFAGGLLLGLALLAAGCGGGSAAPSVASLGTTTSAAAGGGSVVPAGGSFVKFATCLSAHGLAASPGPGGHGIEIAAKIDPNAPLFQAAQRACEKFMPGGPPRPWSPANQAEREQRLLALAKCMRTHGVPSFPDPTARDGCTWWASVRARRSSRPR